MTERRNFHMVEAMTWSTPIRRRAPRRFDYGRWEVRPALIRFVTVIGLLMLLAAITVPSQATLTGTTFEGNDGNLVLEPPSGSPPVADSGTDWCNKTQEELDLIAFPNTDVCPAGSRAPNLGALDLTTLTTSNQAILDLLSGSSDDSLGTGAKEDDASPTEVTGSIPPNKTDLTRFLTAHEVVSNNVFLYLGWERSNILGSANLDFEINKNRCQSDGTGCSGNGVTPARTAGDLLITFDFTNGGGNPVLSLLKWFDTNPLPVGQQCYSAKKAPCWGGPTAGGGKVDLSGSGLAEGQVNSNSVLDPIPPDAPRTLSGLTFGEASVNLTAAGIFSSSPTAPCTSFGSAYVKSRSSTSFTAELKDFIAPEPIRISNCGEIKITKVTSPADQADTFTYDTTGTTTDLQVGGNNYFTLTGVSTGTPPANVKDFTAVHAGTYTVEERDPTSSPGGYDFTSLVCTSSGGASDTTPADGTHPRKTSITMVAGGLTTCTYTNTKQSGSVKVVKVAKNANCAGTSPPTGCSNGKTPLAGAGFQIWKESNSVTGLQTTASGSTPADTKVKDQQTTALNGTEASTCFSGLAPDSYYVHESSVPANYAAASDQTATVTGTSTCSNNTVTVEDTPLSKIEVIFTSQAGSGVTTSQIVCKQGTTTVAADTENGSADSTTPVRDDTDETFSGVGPAVYTCTVDIDP